MSYCTVSSGQAWLVKFIGPASFVIGAIVFAGMFYFGMSAGLYREMFHGGLSPTLVNLFWGMRSLGTLLAPWRGYGLKHIAVDGNSIYISDYFREAKLPLGDILEVSENRWIDLHPITIEFASSAPWSHYIRFMPKIRPLVPQWFPHPVAAELRDMIYWAKGANGSRTSCRRIPWPCRLPIGHEPFASKSRLIGIRPSRIVRA